VYELLGERAGMPAGWEAGVAAFKSGLRHYREQKWSAAEAAFRQCLGLLPEDPPSAAFLERIGTFRETPPAADWDGVWVALSK